MTRATLILNGKNARERAAKWVQGVPEGTRLEFKSPRRSISQNSRLWAMLGDVSRQVEHCGRRYPEDVWKVLFLHACGREVQFLPALDGSTFIPWGQSSSDLSKSEMSDLLAFIEAWGVQNNVVFGDD